LWIVGEAEAEETVEVDGVGEEGAAAEIDGAAEAVKAEAAVAVMAARAVGR